MGDAVLARIQSGPQDGEGVLMDYAQYKVTVPEGESGPWKIKRFTVSEKDAEWHNMREMFGGGGMRRNIRPGEYTSLLRNGSIIMSDTPAEISDHMPFIRIATGSVLINGLGIGMCLKAALAKPDVTDVTVIELSKDVISLVAEHYRDPRLTIINESAFDYKPPRDKEYRAIWHDIWDTISADNLPEMAKLHRKYARRACWQGSWCKPECQYTKRRYG
jgi:hypothetical protein